MSRGDDLKFHIAFLRSLKIVETHTLINQNWAAALGGLAQPPILDKNRDQSVRR